MSLRGFWEAMKAQDGVRQIATKMGGGSWKYDAEQRRIEDAKEARLRKIEKELRK